jgi:hypothetical protein
MKLVKIVFVLLLITGISRAQINVKAYVDHIVPDGVDTLGNIYLTVTGGTSPYTYTWDPGGTNNKDLTNATANTYTIKVKDSGTDSIYKNYKLGYKTYWTNFTSTFFRNDTIFSTTSAPNYPVTGWTNAISKNTLKASQDGWVQWVVHSTSQYIMVGFLDAIGIGGTGLYNDFDYNIYQNGATLYRFYGGINIYLGTCAVGDVLRMERVGTTLTLYKNGVSQYSYTSVNTSLPWKLKTNTSGGNHVHHIGASFFDTAKINFPRYVEDIPGITHSTPGSSDGSIKLSPRISGSTHNYTWTPGGATTSSITGLAFGNYSVNIMDVDSNTSNYNYNVGYKTYWTNFYGTKFTNDTIKLQSPTAPSGWNTVVSKNTLRDSTNGWVEIISKSLTDIYMFGFLDSASAVSGVWQDLDYGVYLQGNKIYRIIAGSYTLLGSFRIGDVVRIERISSTFYVKVNGVTLYSGSCPISKDWKIKTAISTGNVSHIGCSFYDSTDVYFPNYIQNFAVIYNASGEELNTGSIQLYSRDIDPHSYSWMGEEDTTSFLINKASGPYLVTSTDTYRNSSRAKYRINYKPFWTNLSAMNYSNDTLLSVTPYNPSGFSTANSYDSIPPGENGGLEFVVNNVNSPNTYVIGFIDGASVAGQMSDIDHGIKIYYYNVYRVNNGTQTLIGWVRDGDILSINRVGSTLSYKLNGYTLYSSSVSISNSWKYKVALVNGNTIMGIGTSKAPIKVQLAKPHAVLKKIPDNGYYMANGGLLYFTFDGEYNSTNLSYNVYDYTHNPINTCNSLLKTPGDNRYLIDLNVCISPCTTCTSGNIFLLEVNNEKNEKYYLRFMKN